MPGFKDKFTTSLSNLKDHVTSEEFASSTAVQAQSLLATAKDELPEIIDEVQTAKAFGISGSTVVKKHIRDWEIRQLATTVEGALSGATAQTGFQLEQTSVLDVADATLENSTSGIEFEKVGAITDFDTDDPWADMQFDNDTDSSSDDPLDRISFRR